MRKVLVEIFWSKQSFRKIDQLLLKFIYLFIYLFDLKIYGLLSKPYLKINRWDRTGGWKKKKLKGTENEIREQIKNIHYLFRSIIICAHKIIFNCANKADTAFLLTEAWSNHFAQM